METNYRYEKLPELEKLPSRKRIVVFSGAGISVESGVASFRDKDGLWQNFDWRKLASAEGFREDPQGVLDFYNMRRKQLLEIEPNHAHRLLAELEKFDFESLKPILINAAVIIGATILVVIINNLVTRKKQKDPCGDVGGTVCADCIAYAHLACKGDGSRRGIRSGRNHL